MSFLEQLYQIDCGHACGGIVVLHDCVIDAAPIFRWMVGKSYAEVASWKRIVSIREVSA